MEKLIPQAVCLSPCTWAGWIWRRGDIWYQGLYSAKPPAGDSWAFFPESMELSGRLLPLTIEDDRIVYGLEGTARQFELKISGAEIELAELPGHLGVHVQFGAGAATTSGRGLLRWGRCRPVPQPQREWDPGKWAREH